MSNPDDKGAKSRRTRAPKTIEGKARDVTPAKGEGGAGSSGASKPEASSKPASAAAASSTPGASKPLSTALSGEKGGAGQDKPGAETAEAVKASGPASGAQGATGGKPEDKKAASGSASSGDKGPKDTSSKTDTKDAGRAGTTPATPGVKAGASGSGADKPGSAQGPREKKPSPPLFVPLLAGAVSGGLVSALVLFGSGALEPVAAPPAGDTAALESRLAELEARIAEAPATDASPQGGSISALEEEIAALSARLETLENAPAAETPGGDSGAADLAARVQGLAEQLETLRSQTETQAGDEADSDRIDALASSVEERISALDQAVTGLSQRLDALAARSPEEGLEARVTAAAALPLLLSLGDKVASGGETEAELAALSNLGGAGEEVVSILGAGVPSDEDLAGLAEDLRTELAEAAQPQDPAPQGDGILSQLQSSLGSLVTVRRTSDTAAPSPIDPAVQSLEARDFSETLMRLEAAGVEGPAGAALIEALERRVRFEEALEARRQSLSALLQAGE